MDKKNHNEINKTEGIFNKTACCNRMLQIPKLKSLMFQKNKKICVPGTKSYEKTKSLKKPVKKLVI